MALIPFDDRDGVIWMNGEMVEWRDARTHTLTHALHYGSQVFEGERAYGGVIFKSREHTQRLRKSCHYLDFDLPVSDDEMDSIKDQVLAANNIVDGYVRAFCWRGSERWRFPRRRPRFIWRLRPGNGRLILILRSR